MKNSRRRHRGTMARKMMLVMTVFLILLSLFLSLTSWRSASTSFSEMERALYSRTLESVHTQLTSTLRNAQNMVTQLVRLPALRSLSGVTLPEQEEIEYNTRQLNRTAEELISLSVANNTNITLLNVYMKNGFSYGTCPSDSFPYKSYQECCDYLLANGISSLEDYVTTTWIDTTVQPYFGVPTRSIIGMRFLYDSVTMEKIGVIVIGLKESGIRSLYESLAPTAAILRQDGLLLSCADQTMLGQSDSDFSDASPELQAAWQTMEITLADGSASFVERIGGGPCYLVYPVDPMAIEKNDAATSFLKRAMLLCGIALAVTLPLVWLSSRSLTSSLTKLQNVVHQVYDGNLSARFESKKHDDIAYLGSRINDMLEQVEDFFQTQEKDAAEKRDLELRLMQSQINPHLLYNTLNSVVWILRQNDIQKAEKLVLSMGSFFKQSLARGIDSVSLADELNMIRSYFQIQNLGRGKSYVLETDVPEELGDCRILRMTLQPFVENSVIHGFSDWVDDGTVTISAREEEGHQLLLEIRDNGIGILPEELEPMMAEIHCKKSENGHAHYGMYNVERRIQNKYGGQYGIDIQSEVGDHTTVTIRLPIIKEE